MLSEFERKLRTARVRLGVDLFLRLLGWSVLSAGVAAGMLVVFEKCLSLGTPLMVSMAALGGASVVVASALWLIRRPRRLKTAVLADEVLGFRERFSTTEALASSEDAFASAARREAHRAAQSLDVGGKFPVRLTRRWAGAAVAWALAVGALAFMPTLDVLGYFARRQRDRQQVVRLDQARQDVKRVAEVIKTSVARLGMPELDDELAELSRIEHATEPVDVRREAIRKLGDLAEKLKKSRDDARLAGAKATKDMLRNLRGSPEMLSEKLNKALAEGNFAKAAEMMKELRERMEDGELSEEQADALAGQLEDLARQLSELAENTKSFEDDLEAEGLDRDLAGLDEQQLREALEKQGLDAERIEELLKKARACRSACENCRRLGESLSKCGLACRDGQLTADELAELLDRFAELDGLIEDLELTDASLEEIEGLIAGLGEGDCQGGKPIGLVLGELEGKGGRTMAGGRARAWGARPEADDGAVADNQTRVKGETQKNAPAVASWYIKGDQVKGESKRELKGIVQAAREGAAEAVSDQNVPRKYEDAVKQYFGEFEDQLEEQQ